MPRVSSWFFLLFAADISIVQLIFFRFVSCSHHWLQNLLGPYRVLTLVVGQWWGCHLIWRFCSLFTGEIDWHVLKVHARQIFFVLINGWCFSSHLFKEAEAPLADGRCHFLKPTDSEVLEIQVSNIDKVKDLWGHCLLGSFAGRFPGLNAIRNLVDKWNT